MLKNRKSRLALIVSTFGVGASVAPQFALAQKTNALEEVIVTAQKRDETLQDVPITITALTADKLEKSNFTSVNDLQAMVPALRIDQAGAFSQPTVRGVGSSTAGVGFSSNIATYVDGFYIPSQATTNMQLINLQNVEVLKGPQGTLFGRNATGGAILLTMLEPSPTPTAKVRASYGSYNTMNLSAYGSSSLTESIAADISGYKQTSDGFVENTFTNKDDDGAVDRWGVRTSATWDVNNYISFKLAYDHHDWDDSTPNATSALNGQSTTAFLEQVGFLPPGAQIASKPKRVSNDGETKFFSKIDGLYLTSRFNLNDGLDLVSYTMGRRERTKQILDLDSSSVTAFHNFFDIENDAISQEFNLSGTAFDDKLDWIAGLYYLNVDEDYTDLSVKSVLLSAISPGWISLYNVASTIETYAAFTDMTYNITDDWMLTVGARYSYESADGLINIHPLGSFVLGSPPGKTYLDDSWGSFTPRGVLAYKPSANSKAYFSISKGFKAGQISPSSLLPTVSVDPENILAYELGYKFADSTVRFDASMFYYDYKDMQVASYNAVAAIVSNAASSTIYGAETQLSLALTDELTVNFGAAYVHGEYDDYEKAPFFVQQPTAAIPGSFVDVGADASGNQMQRSPKFTGNLGVQYQTPLPAGSLRLNGDYYYTSKFYFDPANQNGQDGYGLLNLAAAWIDPSEAWTLSVYGKNVTNQVYRAQVLPGAFAIQQTYGEPATYGVSVTYKY